MAKRDKREEFTIIETHPEEGPSIDAIMDTLHDWFYGLLITGELRRFKKQEDMLRSSTEDQQGME